MPFALCTYCLFFSLNVFLPSDSLQQAFHSLAAHNSLEVLLHVYLYISFGKETGQFLAKFWANSDIQVYYLIQCLGPGQTASFDIASPAKSVSQSPPFVMFGQLTFLVSSNYLGILQCSILKFKALELIKVHINNQFSSFTP